MERFPKIIELYDRVVILDGEIVIVKWFAKGGITYVKEYKKQDFFKILKEEILESIYNQLKQMYIDVSKQDIYLRDWELEALLLGEKVGLGIFRRRLSEYREDVVKLSAVYDGDVKVVEELG